MKHRQSSSFLKFLILIACLSFSVGSQLHIVGDSTWSIPPNKDFYCNWSSNHFFKTGDNLVFEFQSEFHNVMQVTRRDYDICRGENPLQVYVNGPAIVPLIRHGMVYFICNFSNYCILGQKVSVAVHRHFPRPVRQQPVPSSSSSSSSVPPPAPKHAITKPPAHVNASKNEPVTSRSAGNISVFLEWRWILLAALLYLQY